MLPPEDHDDLRLLAFRNAWRLDALDEWRRNVVDPTLAELRVTLDGLAKKDEIEHAMHNAVKSNRTLRLSTWQRVGAVIYGLAIAYASFGGPH